MADSSNALVALRRHMDPKMAAMGMARFHHALGFGYGTAGEFKIAASTLVLVVFEQDSKRMQRKGGCSILFFVSSKNTGTWLLPPRVVILPSPFDVDF